MADTNNLRIPPHSKEAEESVLGALLLDKDAIIAVAEFLAPDDFYDERHKEIYKAVVSLYEDRTPVDVLTVTEKLKQQKELKRIGGASYLTDVANKVPTAAHVEHYGRIVKDLSIKRSLMQAASRIVEMSLNEGMTSTDLMDKAESEVFSLSQKNVKKAFRPIKEVLAESFDRLDELSKDRGGLRGIATGFPDLDNATAGFQKGNLIILAARPGVGKCVVEDSLIVDSLTGSRRTIKDIFLNKKANILTINDIYKIKQSKVSNFVDDGFKEVYKVTTSLGNKIEVTAIHPLLTINGWKMTKDILAGESIALPREINVFGKKSLEDWKLKVLAYLIGDGGLTSRTPKFTNGNKVIMEDFINSVKKFDNVGVSYSKQSKLRQRTPTVSVVNLDPYKLGSKKEFSEIIKKYLKNSKIKQNKLASKIGISQALMSAWINEISLPSIKTYQKLKKIISVVPFVDRVNPVTKWLIDLNLMGKLSIKKEIPELIFELNKKDISLFLNRLYSCEGSVIPSRAKGVGRISFASSSYELAEGVKHLLLRFGILSRLRDKNIKYKNEFKKAYEVEILNSKDIETFINEIGIFGKEKKVNEIKSLIDKKYTTKNWSKDTIPIDIWKLIIQEKGDLSWRSVYKKMKRPLSHNIHVGNRRLRRETLKELSLALNSKKLLQLAESDVFWDRVVSIEHVGKKHVYDLTVDKTHNFIANDIVVHNTTLAMNIAQHAAIHDKKNIGFFSLEMSVEELTDRLSVNVADIDAWRLKTGKLTEDEFTKLSTAYGILAEAPIYIDDTPGLSILEMRTKARRLQVENGLDLLIVDYLQLARSRNLENRVQEVSEISQGLKNLARELKIPVIALSQLSRGVEARNVKKPQLSDLRESGSIEQDSDIVMFLWREEDDNNESFLLDIAKHRNGPLASIPLFFKGDRIKFFPRDVKH